MRVAMLCFFWLSLLSIGAADTINDTNGGCFGKIMTEKLVGDTITVFTRDNKIITGARPIFIGPSAMYVDSKMGKGIREIGFDNIDRIDYARPSWAKTGFGIVGFSVGSFAGACLGLSVSSLSNDLLDFSSVYSAIATGLAGGIIGAIAGIEIGEHFTVKVNLQCK